MKFPSISKLSCSSFVSFVFDQFSAAVFGTPIHSGQFVFILITCSHHVFHFTLETQLLQVSRLYIGSFVSTLKSAYNVLENLFWFVTSVLDDAASFPEVLTALSCWYSTIPDCFTDYATALRISFASWLFFSGFPSFFSPLFRDSLSALERPSTRPSLRAVFAVTFPWHSLRVARRRHVIVMLLSAGAWVILSSDRF